MEWIEEKSEVGSVCCWAGCLKVVINFSGLVNRPFGGAGQQWGIGAHKVGSLPGLLGRDASGRYTLGRFGGEVVPVGTSGARRCYLPIGLEVPAVQDTPTATTATEQIEYPPPSGHSMAESL